MRKCSVCKVQCERPLQCSKCRKTIYCSAECQKVDWKVHKRSVCAIPAIIHKVDKMVSKNSVVDRLNHMEDIVWEERRRNPRPVWACDGCTLRFHGAPVEDEGDDEEEEERVDVGNPFKHCTECDFTICEYCAHPEGQGTFGLEPPRGTCRCAKSNFGVSYCLSGPSYLDGDRRKPYHGDRHPAMKGSGYDENAFEPRSRKCRNCGVVARCLKKEHLKDVMPGMT